MAAKVHKTLRLEESLVNRIEAQRKEGEAFSLAVNRVLAVGCDTLEGVTRNIDIEHAELMAEHAAGHKAGHDENTQKLIEHMEREIKRLTAEHEADRAAIAEKDRQIADALEKAHELTDQAHTLLGMNSEVRVFPANVNKDEETTSTTSNTGTTSDAQPQPEKKSWWREWFGA